VSRWQPEPLVLGLDADGMAGPAAAVPVPAGGWNAASLQEAMQALQAVGRRRALRVLVAPDLCKHFVHQAPAGVQSLAELRELAALRAAQLFGGLAGEWAVVADWRLAGPSVCAALPQTLLNSLQAAAQGQAAALAVDSALLVALERLLDGPARAGFMAWASPRHAVLVGLDAGVVHTLRCVRRNPAEAGAGLLAQLQRDARREGLHAAGAAGELALAWPGPAPCPPGGFDAGQALPAERADDTEAAWSQRLGALT
jgi:hypothetical protein